MMRFRPKLGSERGSEWRCCGCFHVRTGTILIGSWHLMLHLVALVFLAAIVRDPQLMDVLDQETMADPNWSNIGRLNPNTNKIAIMEPTQYPYHVAQPRDHSLIYHDVDVGALVTVCTLAITLMLIYGAARGKPAHLLPFFCLQIFDFAITVLTATGYLCYLRSIHRLVAETQRVPWRTELLQLPAPALALVVLGVFLMAVLIKGYCINIVWRCYKYCTWRTATLHSLTPFVISSEGIVTAPASPSFASPAPDYSSLLPDYEEAVKQTPPPSYRVATLMAATDPTAAVPIPESPPSEQPSALAPAPATTPAPAPAPASAPAPAPAPAPTPVASETIVVLPQHGDQARV